VSATKPISTPGYLLGVLAGTIVCLLILAIGSGDKTAITFFPIQMVWYLLPGAWLSNLLVGLPLFILLRKLAPAWGLRRFAFVMLIVTPVVILMPCLAGLVLTDYSSLSKLAILEAIAFVMFFGGIVCWGGDSVWLWACAEGKPMVDIGSFLQERPTLKRFTRGILVSVEWFVALCLTITLIVMYHGLYSALWAPRIVYELGYCALATSGPCPLP
jgi:hypothetical protein